MKKRGKNNKNRRKSATGRTKKFDRKINFWQSRKLKDLDSFVSRLLKVERGIRELLGTVEASTSKLNDARSNTFSEHFQLGPLPAEIDVVRKHVATNNVHAILVNPETLSALTGQSVMPGSGGWWFGVRVIINDSIIKGRVVCLEEAREVASGSGRQFTVSGTNGDEQRASAPTN